MKRYRVLLRGENFILNMDGENRRSGFYTTRFVEADTEDEAEDNAVRIIRDDEKLRGAVLNEQSNPPIIYAEEIEEVESFDGINQPVTGYTFFLYQDNGKEDANN